MKHILFILVLICSEAYAADILKMGSPAPPLQIEKWVHGEGSSTFVPGKVYIVEFWATWCGPCVDAMPHLIELQEKHRANGLEVVGIAAREQGERDEALQLLDSWLTEHFPAINYPIGFDSTGFMNEHWMKPAMARGIPTSIVIDREGEIAFIGHPVQLDEVLPQVLDGSWRENAEAKAQDTERIEQSLRDQKLKELINPIYDTLSSALESEDWPKALTAVEEGLALVPDRLDFIVTRFDLLLHKLKDFESGFAVLSAFAEEHMAGKNAYYLSSALERLFDASEDYSYLPKAERMNLGGQLAKRIVDLVPPDGDQEFKFIYLPPVAQYYFESGEPERAIRLAELAVKSLADHPMTKKYTPHYGESVAQGLANYKNEPVCIGELCVLPKPCESMLD